ncbi:hypothetical protein RNJ44_00777 [Nakaseomyces bracarensis]|uniref:Uncharacterized protein n=1 Tax=Nakaseomyces bracarensis TaxID=273131 RepID=A0ABR4NS16_9SACH
MQSPKRITKKRTPTSPLRRRATFALFEETAEMRQRTLEHHTEKIAPTDNKENRPTKTPKTLSQRPPLRSLDSDTHKGYLHDIRRDLLTQL